MPTTIPTGVSSFDEVAAPTIGSTGPAIPGGEPTGVLSASTIGTAAPSPGKDKVVEKAVALAKPIPIGGVVLAAMLITRVVPEYPALARQARVSGTVRLLGVVAKDGTIQRLALVSGHPLLAQAALHAVRQWVYRPTLLNGQPVEVQAPIDVIFTLGQ